MGAVASGVRQPSLLLASSRFLIAIPFLLGVGTARAEDISAGAEQEQPKAAGVGNPIATATGAQLNFARYAIEPRVASWQRDDRHGAYYAGASWAAEDPFAGGWTVNWVHNHRNDADGNALRDQNVVSLAGERDYELFFQTLTLEGEQAWFRDDPEWFPASTRTDEPAGSGTFLQLSGEGGLPLTYRVRFESYDEQFTPYGAAVTPDRDALESRASWRFADLQMRWRWQQYREGVSSDNPVDKSDMGLTVAGPLLGGLWPDFGITGSLDLSERQVSDEAGFLDGETRAAALDFNLPLPADWRGSFGAHYGREENFAGMPSGSISRQFGVSAEQPFDFGGWSGAVTPGLSFRAVRGSAVEGHDLHFSFGLNLLEGPHSLGWNLGYLYRDFEPLAADEGSFGLDYAYKHAKHVFRLKNDVLHRDDPAAAMDYRLTINWTFNYDGVPWLVGGQDGPSWRSHRGP